MFTSEEKGNIKRIQSYWRSETVNRWNVSKEKENIVNKTDFKEQANWLKVVKNLRSGSIWIIRVTVEFLLIRKKNLLAVNGKIIKKA